MATSASGFVLLLVSVSVVQGDGGWSVTYTTTDICALEGSTVEMSCTYTCPSRFKDTWISIQDEFWFIRMNGNEPVDLKSDPQYKDRVSYRCSRSGCTLTITKVKKSDSGVYRFRFISNHPEGRFTGEPGVTLTVPHGPDLQVDRRYSTYSTTTWLKCNSNSKCFPRTDQRSYIWYKNGKEIPNKPYYYLYNFDGDQSYSCALRGHETFAAPSVCFSGGTCSRVIYSDRSICASKGSSVNISCTYSSSRGDVTSKLWFRSDPSGQSPSQPEPDLLSVAQFTGRVQVLEAETGGSTLRITELTETDSGRFGFSFTAGSFEWGRSLAGTSLTVTVLQVQVTRVTPSDQSYVTVELMCQSSCRPDSRSSYVWFRNRRPTGSMSLYYTAGVGPDDTYSCALEGHENVPSPPVYAPELPSVSVVPSGQIVENSLVTLTCSSDANPAAHYSWYKRDSHPEPVHQGPQLVFSSIQASDSGQFYCRAENQLGRRTSGSIYVDVGYPPKTISVSVVPSGQIVEDSSVTLTCSSDANPAAHFSWYKENQTLVETSRTLYFPSITSGDRGSYSCRSDNGLGHMESSSEFIDVQYAPELPSVSVVPSGQIVEDSSVTLTCSSDANPAANFSWYTDDEESPKASGQNFTLINVRAEDGGKYSCEAWNSRGRRRSVVHVTVQAGWRKSAAAGSVAALIVLLLFFSVFLWLRKRRLFQRTPGRVEVRGPDTELDAGSEYDVPAAQQDELLYASVSFSQSQDQALYSNVGAGLHRRGSAEEVEYTTVKPQRRRPEAEEAPSALYSTVDKAPRA